MTRTSRPLAAAVALALAAQAAAAPRIVRPGSASGPTTFLGADSPFSTSCSGPSDACLSFSGAGTDALQAASFARIPIGSSRNTRVGTVARGNDFTVEAAPDGIASTVAARVSTKVRVKGGLAAALEGVAGVDVQLVLLDITDGASNIRPVASRTVFADELTGSLQASVGASPGVLLPVPDAELSVDFGVSGEARKKVVDETVVAELEAIVQRGRTYRIEIELLTRTEIGTGGGVACASFVDSNRTPLSNFEKLPDLVDRGLWLDTLAPMVQLPSVDFSSADFDPSFQLPNIHERTFPGFDWGTVKLPNWFGGPDIQVEMKASAEYFDIPARTVSLPKIGNFNNFDELFTNLRLPDLRGGNDAFREVANWLGRQPTLAEELLVDGGVAVQQLSLVIGDDARTGVLAARDTVLARSDVNRDAVIGRSDANRDAVIARGDVNRDAIMARDDANRTAIMNQATANTSSLQSSISSARTAIIDNADAHHADALAHADANRDDIMTHDDENTQLVLDAIAALHENAERREIQSLLGSGRCEPWMYAPEIPGVGGGPATGGRLLLTLDVVNGAIADAAQVGTASPRDVADAAEDLADAQALASQPLPWPARTAQDICRLLGQAWKKVSVPGSN